jgi:hypothetical protein
VNAVSIRECVDVLHSAGLRLGIVGTTVLQVAPKALITGELRSLIRANKDALIGWLHDEAANDPSDWRSRAMAYGQHHFSCPTCISAGQGCGHRCGGGAYLWTRYCDSQAMLPATVSEHTVRPWQPHEESEVEDEQ